MSVCVFKRNILNIIHMFVYDHSSPINTSTIIIRASRNYIKKL